MEDDWLTNSINQKILIEIFDIFFNIYFSKKLTDKDGISLSTVITSANTHDVSVAIDIVNNMIIKRRSTTSVKPNHNQRKQDLCFNKAYHSKK